MCWEGELYESLEFDAL